MKTAFQARRLAIEAHSTVSVASIETQVRSHLARSSPSTHFRKFAASFRRARSTMTPQSTFS
eukprot:6198671-Pleurochrysis_carterae.AAC.4